MTNRRAAATTIKQGGKQNSVKNYRITTLMTARLLASSLIAVSVVPALPAFAQERIGFDITAQSLSSALLQYANRTGVQLVFQADTVRGLRSRGIKGTFAREDALAGLMSGTDLDYRISGNTVTISKRSAGVTTQNIPAGTTVLAPIVITSGNSPQETVYTTPGSVSYISAQDIQRVPPTSLGDIFKSAPGVVAPGSRVGASVDVNIRGLQGQNRVNVMVDGTRQSNHTYRGYRGSRTEVYVDPDFLGGVDVAKGPVATAGGVGAMGGVVNMRTLEASDILKDGKNYALRIKGGLGSNITSPPPTSKNSGKEDKITYPRDSRFGMFDGDNWSGNIIGAYANEDYEFIAGISRRKAGNYFAGKKGKDSYYSPVYNAETKLSPFGPGKEVFNTSQDMASALLKGKTSWGDGHSLALGYIYYENKYGEMDENFLPYIRSSGSFYRVAQHDLSRTQTHTLKSTYEYKPEESNLISLTANLWYTDIASESNVIRAYSGGASYGAPPRSVETGIRTIGGDVTNVSNFDTALGTLSLRNGIEYVRERAKEDGGTSLSGTYLGANPNGERTLASIFNHTSLKATDWLTVFGSLRYDYYQNESEHTTLDEFNEKSGTRLNPSFVITVEPLDGFQIFSSYTSGWRPPSLRETAVKQASGVSPNPNLRPETSSNIEVGINLLRNNVFQDEDRLGFKAVYFHNTYDDYVIRERFVDPEGFWRYQWGNIDKAKFNGYEFSASYDSSAFFASAGLTLYSEATFCRDKEANLITLILPAGCGADRVAFDYGVMNIPPKYSGNVTAGFNLLEEKLTLGSRVYFFGKRFGGFQWHTGSANEAPYYHPGAIVDLFGSYKFNEDVALDFSVENVGDRYYLDPLSTGLVPAPGCSFKMSFSTRF